MDPLGPWVDWLLAFGWGVVAFAMAVSAWLAWLYVTEAPEGANRETDGERRSLAPGRRASDRHA